jgi:hypothetical protein
MGHLCCFIERVLLGGVVVVVVVVVVVAEDDVDAGELGCCVCCSGLCFDWMARMRVSMSVLKTVGFDSSELSDVLEWLDGEPKPVLA